MHIAFTHRAKRIARVLIVGMGVVAAGSATVTGAIHGEQTFERWWNAPLDVNIELVQRPAPAQIPSHQVPQAHPGIWTSYQLVEHTLHQPIAIDTPYVSHAYKMPDFGVHSSQRDFKSDNRSVKPSEPVQDDTTVQVQEATPPTKSAPPDAPTTQAADTIEPPVLVPERQAPPPHVSVIPPKFQRRWMPMPRSSPPRRPLPMRPRPVPFPTRSHR